MACDLFEDLAGSHYLDTRYLPLTVGARLVGSACRAVSPTLSVRSVCDLGCGPGRLLLPLRDFTGRLSVVGIDRSDAVLGFASRQLRSGSGVRLLAGDCRRRTTLAAESCDITFMHWLLNVCAEWESVLGNSLAWTRVGGAIVWFHETGSLYDAIDGRAADFGCEAAQELWETFYSALGDWGEPERLSSRDGLAFREFDLASHWLCHEGAEVERLMAASVTWSRSVTPRWIVDRVLLPRVFSNLRRVPAKTYGRAMRAVTSLLERWPNSVDCRVQLHYRAFPVVARRLR